MGIGGCSDLISGVIRQSHVADSLGNIAHEHIVSQSINDAPVQFEILEYLGLWSCLIGVSVAIILCLVSFLLSKIRIKSNFLKLSFIGAWLFSFAVYDVGMCIDNQWLTLMWNAPMAMLHAFGSFLFNSDVSEIHTRFFESPLFMALFSVSHALSAFVSALFIIKIFGFNLIQRIRLHFELKRRKETYLFWGINPASYKLVESINKHYNGDTTAYRIIVVKTSTDSVEPDSSVLGFNRIFEIISLKNSELQRLRQMGCFIADASNTDTNSLSGYSTNVTATEHDIIGKELKLKSISRILRKKTIDKIHFILLSDDERQNLHDVSVFMNDSTLNSFAKENCGKVFFYCHARYNGVHRVTEDLHCAGNMEVRVVDSSHINVELLKCNDNLLPIQFVDVEADASVSSSFNAMVIGFSEVGQDVTRFLYEFGAFVKSGGVGAHAVRSDFHLDVIDNRMKDKAGSFVANAPAISLSLSFMPELTKRDALIELHDMDCNSVRFYSLLEERIKTLNYVVIATEDDNLNMTMGIRIFRAATRYRANLDKLCILIRIHDDDDGHFAKIAEYYNKLWASQDETNIHGKNPNKKFRRDGISILPLSIFGQDKDVYTYDNIIDDSVLRKAKEFKKRYKTSTDDKYDGDKKDAEHVWAEDVRTLMQLGDEYHPAYACLMRLRRTQGQDIANSLHWRTKELLRDKAMAKNSISNFAWTSLQRYSERTDYSSVTGVHVDARIARFLTVMAQTEHLRWNASHEILGYVYDENGKDEIRLHHDCLTDWGNLKESVRSYDNNVVDITFGIINPEKKIMTK